MDQYPIINRTKTATRYTGNNNMKYDRSPCPLACALDILGDKWTLLVIRDLLAGKTHFKEFMASPETISSSILTVRLKRLLNEGMIEQEPSTQVAGKMAYRLTQKGRSLYPVLKAVRQWGLTHIAGTKALITVDP